MNIDTEKELTIVEVCTKRYCITIATIVCNTLRKDNFTIAVVLKKKIESNR